MVNDLRRQTGRQSKWGICTNPNCPNYRQKIEIERGDLICPEESCKKPLSPCAPPPKKKSLGQKYGKKVAIIAAVIVVLLGGGFGVSKLTSDPGKITLEKISIEPKELTLTVGERALLKPSVEPVDAKVTYTWKSNDDAIVTVNNGGEVRALKDGEANIVLSTEENNMLKARCTVKVEKKGSESPEPKPTEPIFIKQINVSESAMELTVGETKQIQYTAVPEPNNDKVLYSVSDESIIEYNGGSEVKALKAGKATITFTAEKGGVSAQIEVTVKKKEITDDGNKPGKVNLGYGIYEGPRKNFKADGFGGEIHFTRSYSIDLKKSSGETVEVGSGDKMVNVKMRENHIIQGLLKRADGSQRQIIIG